MESTDVAVEIVAVAVAVADAEKGLLQGKST